MTVRMREEDEHEEFLGLIDAGMRADGAATRTIDDFPLALGPDNRPGQWVLSEGGRPQACLAFLLRPWKTSLGDIPVAAIGSVVTRPDSRGRGLSTRLQTAVLAHLRQLGVPLAVLWSERPELYSGRGFRAAGIEHHGDLRPWSPPEHASIGDRIRDFEVRDTGAVADLYARHRFHTRRRPGEAQKLYGMPGTRGFVQLNAANEITAYVFCGKGADFAHYVLEWGGAFAALPSLLAHARCQAQARWILVPQGGEGLVRILARQGCTWRAQSSGLWAVLAAPALADAGYVMQAADHGDLLREDPRCWLGEVQASGQTRAGPLRLAIWGFDSV